MGMKKVLKIISNCFVCLLIVFLLVILVISFTSKENGISRIGNYSFFDVNGDSMSPMIKDGDYIAINRDIKESYSKGDVVSFLYGVSGGYIIVIH